MIIAAFICGFLALPTALIIAIDAIHKSPEEEKYDRQKLRYTLKSAKIVKENGKHTARFELEEE